MAPGSGVLRPGHMGKAACYRTGSWVFKWAGIEHTDNVLFICDDYC